MRFFSVDPLQLGWSHRLRDAPVSSRLAFTLIVFLEGPEDQLLSAPLIPPTGPAPTIPQSFKHLPSLRRWRLLSSGEARVQHRCSCGLLQPLLWEEALFTSRLSFNPEIFSRETSSCPVNGTTDVEKLKNAQS